MTAGNVNSDFVKQELRAVVSVRAHQAAAAATGGGVGVGVGVGGAGVAQRGQTPQSPLQQGPMIGGGGGGGGGVSGNSTNSMGNATPTGSSSSSGNPMLNTPPDPTLGFSFETRE